MAESPEELEHKESEEAEKNTEVEEEAEAKLGEEEELQTEEDEQRDPGSTMVASWGYNRESEELEVEFQNGKTESYPCTPEVWTQAKETSSAGKWMHQNFL